MPSAFFSRTRPAGWPLPQGTHETISAELTGPGHVTIFWSRDDLTEKGVPTTMVTMSDADLAEIAAAVAAARAN